MFLIPVNDVDKFWKVVDIYSFMLHVSGMKM